MSTDIGSKEFWRLGHRRPWWQWNVITLLVALFLLVWARELLRMPQSVTWVICVAMLLTWAVGPALILVPRLKRSDRTAMSKIDTVAGFKVACLLGAIIMWLAVVWSGGLLAGLFCALAARLYAQAVRAHRSEEPASDTTP